MVFEGIDAVEDAVVERLFSPLVPEVSLRVQFGRIRGQEQQAQMVGQAAVLALVPPVANDSPAGSGREPPICRASLVDSKRSFSDDRTLQIGVSARLIRKAYKADPLERPKCQGPIRVMALIEDPQVICRILKHLGRWAPQVSERSPPLGPEAWPVHAGLPLTYHPVPDIA